MTTTISYSKDVDALLVELSQEPIAYTDPTICPAVGIFHQAPQVKHR